MSGGIPVEKAFVGLNDAFAPLEKAAGAHTYVSREPASGGGWKYTYNKPGSGHAHHRAMADWHHQMMNAHGHRAKNAVDNEDHEDAAAGHEMAKDEHLNAMRYPQDEKARERAHRSTHAAIGSTHRAHGVKDDEKSDTDDFDLTKSAAAPKYIKRERDESEKSLSKFNTLANLFKSQGGARYQ